MELFERTPVPPVGYTDATGAADEVPFAVLTGPLSPGQCAGPSLVWFVAGRWRGKKRPRGQRFAKPRRVGGSGADAE